MCSETKDSTIVADKQMGARFKRILDALDTKISTVAAESGVSADTMYQFARGKQNLTLESLAKIKKVYPDINLDYLILGKEPVLLTKADESKPTVTITVDGDVNLITKTL